MGATWGGPRWGWVIELGNDEDKLPIPIPDAPSPLRLLSPLKEKVRMALRVLV